MTTGVSPDVPADIERYFELVDGEIVATPYPVETMDGLSVYVNCLGDTDDGRPLYKWATFGVFGRRREAA